MVQHHSSSPPPPALLLLFGLAAAALLLRAVSTATPEDVGEPMQADRQITLVVADDHRVVVCGLRVLP